MIRHSQRAGAALLHLADYDPGLAALALWCAHRDDTGQTRTRGETILYGPEFSLLARQEAIGLAGHHILHVALRHAARSNDMALRLGERFDATLYALCADAVINETLLAAGHALPRPAVTLTGLLAASLTPAVSPLAALGDWDTDRLYLALQGRQDARGKARDYGRGQAFQPDLEGDDSHEPASAEDWRGHLLRALATGQAAGQGIGTLATILREVTPSGIVWERQLRRLLARALTQETLLTYRRPANRWIAAEAAARAQNTSTPAFQPATRRDGRRLSLVVALDLSSSIDDVTLDLFCAELEAIARRTWAQVTVLAFDSRIQSETTLSHRATRDALRAIDLRRGGGTDFAPVMDRARALRPSALIVLSDLDGPSGDDPRVPVIWCVPRAPLTAPPFGRVLAMDAV